ncbi:hypothetical protein JCM10213_002290 [Rhodosporidiobolus nylandii]
MRDKTKTVETAQALHAGNLPLLEALYIPFSSLPSSSLPSSSLPSSSTDLANALSHLRATCAARNIEVIDEPPFHPYYDSLVSREFWRRCKAIKEEEEREKKGEARA